MSTHEAGRVVYVYMEYLPTSCVKKWWEEEERERRAYRQGAYSNVTEYCSDFGEQRYGGRKMPKTFPNAPQRRRSG